MSKHLRVPAATLILIAINLLAAFLVRFSPDSVPQYGFSPSEPSAISAVTCLFFHLNLFHLAGNMVYLAAVAPAVEFASGVWRFLAVYLLGGLGGVVVHWLLMKGLETPPLIGASGCVASCAAYYSIRFRNLRVPIGPNIGLPVYAITFVWLLLQIVGAFVRLGDPGGSVAFWAHVGGFGVGLLLSLVFSAGTQADLQFGHDVLDRMNSRGPAAVLAAAQEHIKTHPKDPRAHWELADAYHLLGDDEHEIQVLIKLLELEPRADDAAVVLRLEERSRLSVIPTVRRMQIADRLKSSDPGAASALLSSIIKGPQDEVRRPDAMLALADLCRPSAEEESKRLVQLLAKEYPLHPATDLARQRGWTD